MRNHLNDDAWRGVLQRGPAGLLEAKWDLLQFKVPPETVPLLRIWLQDVVRQTEWIVKRTKSMRDEAERVELLGKTMRAAGLRSYTDDKGRIFVAEHRGSE